MSVTLKQGTATTIQLGPFTDATGAPLTALTPTVEVSLAGAAFTARTAVGAITHDADGWYRVPLDATDTGTLGRLVVSSQASGALPVWTVCEVVPANVYDALVGGTDLLDTAPDAATVRAAVGLTSANLDTQLAAIDDFLDTEVAAILAAVDTETSDILADTATLKARVTQTLADRLQAHVEGIGVVVVGSGSTTALVALDTVNGAAPSATDDFYNGRVLVFTSGALALQATAIAAYDGTNGVATVAPLTNAPATGVTAILV